MGRSAHAAVRLHVDHPGMDDCGTLHLIEDDLSDDLGRGPGPPRAWTRIESYLAKHLAFLTFLDEASA